MPRRLKSSTAVLLLACTFLFAATASAQKTDVVTLANGDRITGEVVALERGRLEFKTDDAGTLYLEWDKLTSVVAGRQVEVVTGRGDRFVGTLGRSTTRSMAVVTPAGEVTLRMIDVTLIRSIKSSFWRRLDGSIDAGFSYTRSSGVAQLYANSDTVVRRPAFQGRLTASLTQTRTANAEQADSEGDGDRATVEVSYRRYRWQEWFVSGAGRFERNESLGIALRSQLGAAVGPRLVNSNRAQLVLGAGLAVNDERGVDVEATQNVEALLMFGCSFYTYDRPKTNIDVDVQYYPSLSNTGRHRLQLDAGVKREFWKDLFVAVTLYNTYDNRPPSATADQNDVGVVLSLGWSY